MKPSSAAVLALLRTRGDYGVSSLDALASAGCLRLSARIYDLKADGFCIEERLERTTTGKYVSRYRLHEEAAG